MLTKPKNISPIKREILNKRLTNMLDIRHKVELNISNYHVYISKGNNKTGDLVPSVSLIPIVSCGNCGECHKLCYDIRNDCVYETVQNTRAINDAIARNDMNRYFKEISEFCKGQEYFRWHVGGDILNADYWDGVVLVAENNPQCTFLIFTKMYDIVNRYMDLNHVLPKNLRVVFSAWVGMEMNNPHNFPTSNPVFADGSTTAHDGAKYCSGNCSECAVRKNGCFDLNPGEEVIFLAH